MFEKLYDEIKKEFLSNTKKLVLKLQNAFDKVWEETLNELQKRKLTLEDEIKDLEKTKGKKEGNLNRLADEVIKNSEGIEKQEELLENFKGKIQDEVDKLGKLQNSVQEIVERESNVEKKEKALKEQEVEIKARLIQLEEKRKSAARILEKIGETP